MSENKPPNQPNRRADSRVGITWKASIRCADWRGAEKVAVTNLSNGGMFIRTNSPPPVGMRVEIALILPDQRKERLTGIVRHQIGAGAALPGVGIETDPSCKNAMLALAEIARIEQQSGVRAQPPQPPSGARALSGVRAQPPQPPSGVRAQPPQPDSAPRSQPAKPDSQLTTKAARPKPERADGVGVDFGMSHSRIAVCSGKTAGLVPDLDGRVLMPSLVAFPEGEPTAVGWEAHALQASLPHRTLNSLKRLLGRKHSDPLLSGLLHSLLLPHRAGPDGGVLIEVERGPLAMPQLCALILGRLKSAAEEHLGCEITRAAFSHPVTFGQSYKTALQRAALLAGLEVAGFIEEPVAAALGYGLGRSKNEIVAVYDFGGGTFDFSLVDISYGHHRVLGSGGDEWLGGDDFDGVLAEAAANAYWRKTKIELRDRAVEWVHLLRAAEISKRELSSSQSARLTVQDVSPCLDFTIDRPIFAQLARELLDRSLEVCRQTLEQVGLEPGQISHVVLSGGTSQIPFIQEALSRWFERPIANTQGFDPQEAVALGTSMFAARLGNR